MTATGDDLFALVEQYASLEHHCTGTPEDTRNIAWFADAAQERGASVERLPWAFDGYEATWRVTLDSEEIPSLPLFYQGVGRVERRSPFRAAAGSPQFPASPAAALDGALRRTGCPCSPTACRRSWCPAAAPSGWSRQRCWRAWTRGSCLGARRT